MRWWGWVVVFFAGCWMITKLARVGIDQDFVLVSVVTLAILMVAARPKTA